jgi:hypothetical protein
MKTNAMIRYQKESDVKLYNVCRKPDTKSCVPIGPMPGTCYLI